MLETTVEITGLEENLARLSYIESHMQSLEPAMQEAGHYLLEFFMNKVFESQGAVYGDPWEALSEAYSAIKEKKYGSQLILVASGKMMHDYKLYTASDYLIVQNEAQNQRGDYYAAYHQEGTTRMPKRVLLKMQEEQIGKVVGIIVGHLNGIINT